MILAFSRDAARVARSPNVATTCATLGPFPRRSCVEGGWFVAGIELDGWLVARQPDFLSPSLPSASLRLGFALFTLFSGSAEFPPTALRVPSPLNVGGFSYYSPRRCFPCFSPLRDRRSENAGGARAEAPTAD